MSMSQQTIEIHFKEVLAIAEKIRYLSEELGKIGQETIPGVICDTKRRWTSESAQKLVERELKVSSRYCEASRGLETLAAEMKEQAEEMYRTEMCNLTLASTRTY